MNKLTHQTNTYNLLLNQYAGVTTDFNSWLYEYYKKNDITQDNTKTMIYMLQEIKNSNIKLFMNSPVGIYNGTTYTATSRKIYLNDINLLINTINTELNNYEVLYEISTYGLKFDWGDYVHKVGIDSINIQQLEPEYYIIIRGALKDE